MNDTHFVIFTHTHTYPQLTQPHTLPRPVPPGSQLKIQADCPGLSEIIRANLVPVIADKPSVDNLELKW